MPRKKDPSVDLAKRIAKGRREGTRVTATLRTDDRVLARITDGIYRQPASALRELISNAYDADAKQVHIQTDAPRFSQISIRDDGAGLTEAALANLIFHIGGSPKRTLQGVDLKVVSPRNPTRSPRGRKLIGKIGIGLFSVAQMTRHFQIITKRRGEDYRLVADVLLKTYSEDELSAVKPNKPRQFETGTVKIWHVPASDRTAHGTEVVLMDIRDQTRDLLQTRHRWLQKEGPEQGSGPKPSIPTPKYHISQVAPDAQDLLDVKASLPWQGDDSPREKFAKLVQAVIDEVGQGTKNPKLEYMLDNYLQMLWTLSLSGPLDYIDKHPFGLTPEDGIRAYVLSNDPGGQAKDMNLARGQTIRDKLDLRCPERGHADRFSVFVDEVQLFRPVRFTSLATTTHAIKEPLLFIGKHDFHLKDVPKEMHGGQQLSFEGYLFWTPKVVPTEHIGILVRIGDSNGTLFDESFMKYQVSEQTRLKQVTAEIFVKEGLDAALNIDRESFNYAHPHYQVLTKWVHNAFRQFATKHKALAKQIRDRQRSQQLITKVAGLGQVLKDEFEAAVGTEDTTWPEVILTDDAPGEGPQKRRQGAIVFDKKTVLSGRSKRHRRGAQEKKREALFEQKVKGLVALLDAYGAFEDMPYERQQELVRAIARLFAFGVDA